MMTHSIRHALRRVLFVALAVLFVLPAQAQDRPDRAARFAEALDLTDAQTQLVTDVLADPEVGDLWVLAADLAPTLSAAQKEKLLARPERPSRGDRMRGERKSGDRIGQERAERREAMQKRRAEQQEAMQSALGLTDAQVRQLDALRAEGQAEREARRAQREERRAEQPDRKAEFAEVLTPEQQEIAEVHRALAMRLHAGRAHRRASRR